MKPEVKPKLEATAYRYGKYKLALLNNYGEDAWQVTDPTGKAVYSQQGNQVFKLQEAIHYIDNYYEAKRVAISKLTPEEVRILNIQVTQ